MWLRKESCPLFFLSCPTRRVRLRLWGVSDDAEAGVDAGVGRFSIGAGRTADGGWSTCPRSAPNHAPVAVLVLVRFFGEVRIANQHFVTLLPRNAVKIACI